MKKTSQGMEQRTGGRGSGGNAYRVERFEFADGVVWDVNDSGWRLAA